MTRSCSFTFFTVVRLTVFCFGLFRFKASNANIAAAFLAATLFTPLHAQTVLDYPSAFLCKNLKFNWYCDKEPEQPEPIAPTPSPAPPVRPIASPKETTKPAAKRLDIKDITTTTQLREELKRREDLAIMYPTASNVRDFAEMNQFMQEKSLAFAQSWQKVNWQNPDIDYSVKNPSAQFARNVATEKAQTDLNRHLSSLSSEHGLIFFYRSDCPFCHAMSNIITVFAKTFKFDVLPVAIDAKSIGLPKWVPNKGQYETLMGRFANGDTQVPATFVASKKTKDVALIAVGAISLEELKTRLHALTSPTPTTTARGIQ
jgi:conjugal transfer pilus assembly protein TraF